MQTVGEIIYAPKLTLVQKIEKFLSFQDHQSKYLKKNVYKSHNVCVVLTSKEKDARKIFADPSHTIIDKIERITLDDRIEAIRRFIRGMNLVGDAGEILETRSPPAPSLRSDNLRFPRHLLPGAN